MNLEKQIKYYRILNKLSQEDLAEQVFVSRQTISNWETGKNYPDINSLFLLSKVFSISIDELVKGDIKEMTKIIKESDINRMKQLGIIYFIGLLVVAISAAPLFWFFDWIGLIPWSVLLIVVLVISIKLEKVKKEYDIQTYREIVSFYNGERLDEIEKAVERGKKPYQKVIYVCICAFLSFIITYAIMNFLKG